MILMPILGREKQVDLHSEFHVNQNNRETLSQPNQTKCVKITESPFLYLSAGD